MSKKPVTMSVSRPSRVVPAAEVAPAEVVPPTIHEAPAQLNAVAPVSPNVPERPVTPSPAATRSPTQMARLDQGVKRIVVDVSPSVHVQVKVKAAYYPGGIKEYILRLLEADGLDMSKEPDFVPRPK